MQPCDVVIVGAGPVGLCLACALAPAGLQVVVVESQPRSVVAQPAYDGREIALTHASRHILQGLGLWQRLASEHISPLQSARVFNGASLFSLDFASRRDEPLGWLVSNHRLRQAAWNSVQGQPGVEVIDSQRVTAINPAHAHTEVTLADGRCLSAKVVVAADSRFSQTRAMVGIGAQMRDFGRSMWLCRVEHERSHAQAAWEWFAYPHTLALLPLNGNTASVVVTLPNAQAQALNGLDDAALGAHLSALFEHRLGAMTPVGSRHMYPLVAVYAQRFAGPRYAVVGDAAVGMHPVTAHGFNLGLQGQHRLAAGIVAAAGQGRDIGSDAVLHAYERAHRLASRPLYEATNALVSLYTDARAPARLLRGAALRLAQHAPPFKALIAAQLTQRQAG